MSKPANTETVAPSRFGVWIDHHLHSIAFSLGRAMRKPWATLLTIVVMALALALPLGLSIALGNVKLLAGSVQQSREINLFLKVDVAADAAQALAGELRARRMSPRSPCARPSRVWPSCARAPSSMKPPMR